MGGGFWGEIAQQYDALQHVRTVDEVFGILNDGERFPLVHAYSQGSANGSTIAFFAGSGGDDSLAAALRAAGWRAVWAVAPYWWAKVPPDGGEGLTYIEGDVYRGVQPYPKEVPDDADDSVVGE
jgi:hypothetical protein